MKSKKEFIITTRNKNVYSLRNIFVYSSVIYPVLGGIFRPDNGSIFLFIWLFAFVIHLITIVILFNLESYIISGQIVFNEDSIIINDKIYYPSEIESINFIFDGIKGDRTKYPLLGMFHFATNDGGNNILRIRLVDGTEQTLNVLLEKKERYSNFYRLLKIFEVKGVEIVSFTSRPRL